MTDLTQLIASLRAGTVTPADLDAAADALAGKVAVKPLEWIDPTPPNEECAYDHVFADSALGRYSIEWKSWKEYDDRTIFLSGACVGNGGFDLDVAKAAAQADYAARILAALEPAPLTVADALAVPEVRALVDALRTIAGMKPHHAGETVNEYHMQVIANAALHGIGGAE